jgi:hypothetical protein
MNQEHEDETSGRGDAPSSTPPKVGYEQPDPKPSVRAFHPIRIIGEPLSETILRERR